MQETPRQVGSGLGTPLVLGQQAGDGAVGPVLGRGVAGDGGHEVLVVQGVQRARRRPRRRWPCGGWSGAGRPRRRSPGAEASYLVALLGDHQLPAVDHEEVVAGVTLPDDHVSRRRPDGSAPPPPAARGTARGAGREPRSARSPPAPRAPGWRASPGTAGRGCTAAAPGRRARPTGTIASASPSRWASAGAASEPMAAAAAPTPKRAPHARPATWSGSHLFSSAAPWLPARAAPAPLTASSATATGSCSGQPHGCHRQADQDRPDHEPQPVVPGRHQGRCRARRRRRRRERRAGFPTAASPPAPATSCA